ncbi:hypothetical protein GYMLUDRAFT_38014 [Collybiopsis luxurians FD-317 M1]|nr:hypothetical protein GYMLUDRAFT_38014 [Collybiopsis luxurians FD-317 M1]
MTLSMTTTTTTLGDSSTRLSLTDMLDSSSISDLVDEPVTLEVANELLRCNDVPVQLEEMQKYVSKAEILITDFDRYLEVLEAQMKAVRLRKDHIRLVSQTYRKAIRAIRRLPPEILQKIFLCCVDDPDPDDFRLTSEVNSLDARNAPWSLAHVCKLWRSIALSSPQLWSFLTIDLSIFQHDTFSRQLKLESQASFLPSRYLALSRGRPLNVTVVSKVPSDPLLLLICSHSFRWRNVAFSLPPAGLQVLSTVQECVPLLEHLHIHIPSSQFPGWEGETLTAFKHAPKLTSVIAENISDINKKLLLPWEQIETWDNGSRNRDTKIYSLANANTLVKSARLRKVYIAFYRNEPSTRQFRLSSLSFLYLTRGTFTSISRLLDSLTLLVLQILRISFQPDWFDPIDDPRPGLFMRSLIGLIKRSKAPLHSLHLSKARGNFDDEASHFEEMFSLLTSLQIFGIHKLSDSILRVLLCPEGSTPLLPFLKELCFESTALSFPNQELLDYVLESRMKHSGQTHMHADRWYQDGWEHLTWGNKAG